MVSISCGRVLEPTEYDLHLVMRVLRCINETIGYGLYFSNRHRIEELALYCDAAYGIYEGRSKSAGTLVYAKSSKQAIVTKLTTESKLLSLCEGVTVFMALKNFFLSDSFTRGVGAVNHLQRKPSCN